MEPPTGNGVMCCPICDQPFDKCNCDEFLGYQDDDEEADTVYYPPPQSTMDFPPFGRSVTPQPPNPSAICRFFMSGNCRFGERCHFLHPLSIERSKSPESVQQCKFFLEGLCRNGENCIFRHDSSYKPPEDTPHKKELKEKFRLLEEEIKELTGKLEEKERLRMDILSEIFAAS